MELIRDIFDFFGEAFSIWESGGWAMIAIAIVAMLMFGLGVRIYLSLWTKGFQRVPERVWRRWIEHPEQRRGPIGELIDYAMSARSVHEVSVAFEELRATEVAPFERDLKVMRICVSAAPLLGLLGTVTGMLTTFAALATGSGGDKTMNLVAGGISEALVTTATGLIIALPGLFFQYQLARMHARYDAFLAHLETACAQSVHQRIRNGQLKSRQAA